MSKVAGTALTVVLSFITTLILTSLINYLQDARGTTSVGPRIATQGGYIRLLEISNQTNGPLEGLLLQIPKSTGSGDMTSSSPIQITDVADNVGTSEFHRVRLNGIPPGQVIRC